MILMTLMIVGCSDDQTDVPDDMMMTGDDPFENAVIWTGSEITFTLENNSDITDSANQDRLSDNVIITRGADGGQIFNIATEAEANQTVSPAGTEWAEGRTSDLANLTFAPFRAAVGEPQNVVGKDLVLHLIEDDIYLNVSFTSWTMGRNSGGGFSYMRATP